MAEARVDGMACCVTGGAGLVGRRLCEMLVQRGARRVVAFDIAPKPADWDDAVEYLKGDLTKPEDVLKACQGADCVWHVGALVGPYHPQALYKKVNYEGTLHVIEACKQLGIRKIVFSSSPGTRFDGSNIRGLTEDQLTFPKKYLQPYAETKAMGERACMAACDGKSLLTIAVAPHQVYGPRDVLFLANFLKASPKLRVFGTGKNKVSVCYVDNYCHALILGEKALYPGSPALGRFYIATDGDPVNFWDLLDDGISRCGYPSIKQRMRLPYWFIMGLAHIVTFLGALVGKKPRLNPFSVTMMVIDRYFDISNIKKDLGYEPVVDFKEGWATTIQWYKDNWIAEHGPPLPNQV